MADMLNIGKSALLSYQVALNTVSNNIANANTQGYNRERTDLQDSPGQVTGYGMAGTGVYVYSVSRITDGFIGKQLVSDASNVGRIDVFQTYASTVDGWLSDANTGLSTPLQGFFTAMNGVASNPTSSAARSTLLQSAQQLSSSLKGMQQQLDGLDHQVLSNMGNTVSEINSYTKQLAQLNQQILQLSGMTANGQPPNDLLDQRDQLLQNLAGDIGITTTTESNGSIDVFAASGQALVLGSSSMQLSMQSDQYGNGGEIMLGASGGTNIDITRQVSGGKLGGMMDFRREVLNPAIDQVGRIAVGVAQAINTQQQQGMDLYGQLGGALFSTPAPLVQASSANTGTASLSATIADPNQLGTGDYVLKYSGASWTMTDQVSGAQVTLTGTGTAADPLVGNGMQLVIGSGAAAAGDTFLVQPTRYAAGQVNVLISDPARIAAASPVQSSAATANTGDATIGNPQVVDITNPALLTTSQIQFVTATTYTIDGGPVQTYTSGSDIVGAGWKVQISGAPAAGDTFTVKANVAGSSDNSNANLMAAVASQKILGGGVDTLADANGALVSGVGAQAQQAKAQLSAATALQSQDQAAHNSISGVNLDEEAASLTQFQQAYQASAQVIATANSLFQTLLNALH
jgi:flagellar hook-associated protein 1 FlgK